MTVFKVGQTVEFRLPLKVLRAFAHNHSIYYIVGITKKTTPLGHQGGAMWGVLNVDGSFTAIPAPVMTRAAQFVADENLLQNLE